MSRKSTRSKRAADGAATPGAAAAIAAVGRANTAAAPASEPLASDVLDAVFAALAHPARRRILLVLHARGGAMGAGEIADRFKHAWPTTTRHLGVLEEAGVLHVVKQGRQRLYTLRPRLLIDAASWLHGWASLSSDDVGTTPRPEWASLPYATMRNATSPGRPPRRRRAT